MCLCDWPDHCDGLGVLQCNGCGGDFCLCECGGEAECGGCTECRDVDEYDDADAPDDCLDCGRCASCVERSRNHAEECRGEGEARGGRN